MKIKFKAPDPRAGTVVQLDSSRAQHFIDTGAAVLVKDDDHRSTVARAELDKALASIPRDETDADYLVGAMRAHFKDVFTGADEAKVRAAVDANASAQQAEDLAAAEAKAKQEAEEQAARDKAAAEEQARKDEEARLAAEEASRLEAEERAAAEAAAAAEKEKAAAEAKAKGKGKGKGA